jgi:rhodanese-related sulfurtransferase
MLEYLKNLLGIGKRKELLLEAIRKGSYIIDVRTPQEYRIGHIQQAVNIPLELISKNADKIAKIGKPVITCCQSGGRSGRAASRLHTTAAKTVIRNLKSFVYIQILQTIYSGINRLNQL